MSTRSAGTMPGTAAPHLKSTSQVRALPIHTAVGLEAFDTAAIEPVLVGDGCRRIDLPSPEGTRFWIVEMDAGATWPHIDDHGDGGELVFVLSGSMIEGDCTHGPGTLLKFGPGSSHRPSSATGVRLFGYNPQV